MLLLIDIKFIRPIFVSVLSFVLSLSVQTEIFAQNSNSGRPEKKLFKEDSNKAKKAEKDKDKTIRTAKDPGRPKEIKIQAPKLKFDKDNETAEGTGGFVVSYGLVKIESDKGKVNTKTKDIEAEGNIAINHSDGAILAKKANFNADTELGKFDHSKFKVEEGGFNIVSDKAEKLSEFDYRLENTKFTTCDINSKEDSCPWSLNSDSADIEEDGYAYTKGTTFNVMDVPVFYSPYLVLPVKVDRASGLLFPEPSINNRDGVGFRQPIFFVANDSTDVLLEPFIQTKSRVGSAVMFRKIFTADNTIRAKLFYSDESARDGNLRGILLPRDFDLVNNKPRFEEQRVGGFLEHIWSSERDDYVPLNYVADIHYVPDDLFPREINDSDIVQRSSQYATSRMALVAGIGDYTTASVSGEYNQEIDYTKIDEDKKTIQRLPEVDLYASRSFKAFGENDYGLKLVAKGRATSTWFARETGAEGNRTNFSPGAKIPFHYKNYFYGSLGADVYDTRYNLNDVEETIKDPNDVIDRRKTIALTYTTSTELEKVYDIDPEGFLSKLTTLGVSNEPSELKRVKHTIQPIFKYTYIPDVADQFNDQVFNQFDVIKERSIFTYGINSSILGRFQRRGSDSQIEDITPTAQDLPLFDYRSPFSLTDDYRVKDNRLLSSSREIRELVKFGVKQGYDFIEAGKSNDEDDPARGKFTDVGTGLTITPTDMFRLGVSGTMRPRDKSLSGWDASIATNDDRGDNISLTYSNRDPEKFEKIVGVETETFQEDIGQLIAATELVLTDRYRLGFFGRYDQSDREFVENAAAVRYYGGSNCWSVDLGVSERSNPDNRSFLIRFTLNGLGGFSQNLWRQQADGSDNRQ